MDSSNLFAAGLLALVVVLLLMWTLRRKPRREIPAYYRTAHWARFSKAIKEQHGNRCDVCGLDWQRRKGVRLQVHHYRYRDTEGKSLDFREGDEDVTCLCARHHRRGAYGPEQVRRDRRSYLIGKAVRGLLFLPFRLIWALFR